MWAFNVGIFELPFEFIIVILDALLQPFCILGIALNPLFILLKSLEKVRERDVFMEFTSLVS